MFLKLPKNGEKISWTRHAKEKMRQYQLSEKRVLRILWRPERKETGIAPETIAAMQSTGSKKHPTEIWLMYQIANLKSKKLNLKNNKRQIRIISAWRYPGRSPIGEPPPIPEEILKDLIGENKMLK